MAGEFAYLTVADVRPALQLAGIPAPEDGLLLRTIQAASARVNTETGRVFTATTQTRALDAPPQWTGRAIDTPGWWVRHTTWGSAVTPERTQVSVPDLQSVTNLTAFGAALTADTDYQILRYTEADGRPGATRLIRVAGGQPVSWYYNTSAPRQPWGALVVTGVFCYDLSGVPAAILEVTEALVLKTWARRVRQYNTGGTDGTSVDSVTLDADLKQKLTPFKLTEGLVLI